MNDYPTKKELKSIREWKFDGNNIENFLQNLEDVWNSNYGQFILSGKRIIKLSLHTRGWSGNEDIINALKESFFWIPYWQKSCRGGHYYFKIEREKHNEL